MQGIGAGTCKFEGDLLSGKSGSSAWGFPGCSFGPCDGAHGDEEASTRVRLQGLGPHVSRPPVNCGAAFAVQVG
jgi:hypothetical protein